MSNKIEDIFSAEVVDLFRQANWSVELKDFVEGKRVDVKKLAEHLGYTVKEKEFDLSGELVDKMILVNKDNVGTRQRFTIAHELGHAAHHLLAAKRRGDSGAYELQERFDEIQANKFAADLLMPKSFVVDALKDSAKKHGFNEQSLSADQVTLMENDASEQLNVSSQALTFRVENLGIFRKLPDEKD